MATTRTRCFRVEIETPPEDTAKSIAFHREAVIEDGGAIIGRATVQPQSIRLPFLPGLAQTVREVADPVTGQTVRLSGAGLAAWITAEYEAQQAAEAERIAAEQAAEAKRRAAAASHTAEQAVTPKEPTDA